MPQGKRKSGFDFTLAAANGFIESVFIVGNYYYVSNEMEKHFDVVL